MHSHRTTTHKGGGSWLTRNYDGLDKNTRILRNGLGNQNKRHQTLSISNAKASQTISMGHNYERNDFKHLWMETFRPVVQEKK